MNKENSLPCDTNSWHYKVVNTTWKNYHYTPVPRNFCPYMRKLVLSIFALPFVLLWRKLPQAIQNYEEIALVLFVYAVIVHSVYAVLFIASGGVYMEREWVESTVVSTTAKQLQWWWGTAFYLGSVAVVSTLIGLVVVVCNYLDDRKQKQREAGNYTRNKSVNLIKDYFESKHNKICPFMDFYDSKEEKKDG